MAHTRPAQLGELVLLIVLVQCAAGVPRSALFPFGSDYGDNELPKIDEVSSPEIKFPLPLLYYSQEYRGAYVNANGIVSFLTELPNFYNVPFPLEYPLIAPFYSDVDLTGTGSVYYRVTDQETLLHRFDSRVKRHFSGGGSFMSGRLLIVTWVGVGYFNAATDKTNTYQLVLGWNGRETFAQFLYADGGVQWIVGEGKTPHHADARAQAGLVSGDGRMLELQHSGTDQVRHLDRLSNCEEPGVYIFRVGRIENGKNADLPDTTVRSHALQQRPDTCATGGLTCHSDATCHDHVDGFCCVCNPGFYGNGVNCLTTDEPLRIMGPLYGNLNGYSIDGEELQSYAVVADGRAYTSLAKMIASIGYDLQSVMPVSDVIGWMFAKPADGVRNGFQLTGGVANVTIDVDYPQTGDHLVLQQDFSGTTVFDHLAVSTRISGTVPAVTLGSEIQMDSYTNTIVSLGRGRVKINSQRQFRQTGNGLNVPMTMEADVRFEECQGAQERPEQVQLTHIVDRNFIKYEKPEQIVRFASSNSIRALEDGSPCQDADRKCGPNSVCLPDGPTDYRCECRPGFVHEYREGAPDASLEELRICTDVNECERGLDNCHEHATCSNEFGSYACLCLPEYTGNGQHCDKLTTCADLMCGDNAACYEYSRGSPVCECDIGFVGDGVTCEAVPTPECQMGAECGLNSECRHSEWRRTNECVCAPGHRPKNAQCSPTGPVPGPCGGMFCHSVASCVEVEAGQPHCVCDPGFYGNGLECNTTTHTDDVCQSAKDCGPNAECTFADWADGNLCVCVQGYITDGLSCIVATPLDVLCGGVECHPAADCQSVDGQHRCVCNAGLHGDGHTVCRAAPAEIRCETFADCGPNAECDFADWLSANICFCRTGFFGDGVNCSVATSVAVLCNNVECHSKAECVQYDVGNPLCVCQPDFFGDGVHCVLNPGGSSDPHDTPCDSATGGDTCVGFTSCSFAPWAGRELCLCRPGSIRVGSDCMPDDDPLLVTGGCLEDADCAEGQRCDYQVDSGLFDCVPTPTVPFPGTGCLEDSDCAEGERCEYQIDTGLFGCMPTPAVLFPGPVPMADCSRKDVCSPHAVCNFNVTQEAYVCLCRSGYTGDGYTCLADSTAAPPTESPDKVQELVEPSCIFGFCVCPEDYDLSDDLEECVFRTQQTPLPHCMAGTCSCPSTYHYVPEMDACVPTGDGEYDTKGPSGTGTAPPVQSTAPGTTGTTDVPTQAEPQPCRGEADCDDNAHCAYSASSGRHQCSCFPGYLGDGSTCEPAPDADCSVLKNCHPEAACVYDSQADNYRCQCRRGYEGDGKECVQVTLGCNILDNCSERAECLYDMEELRFRCRCRPGFSGDGYTCQHSISCYDDPRQCDVSAACVPDLDGFRCVCLKNFVGDGRHCTPAPRHDGGFLLLSQGSAVVKVPFEARKRGRPVILEPTQTAVGIDTDCLQGRVIWTDVAGRRIMSAAYNGSQQRELAGTDISSPEGVSVDFISRNVYWTDSSRDVIEVASIATGNRFTVISSGLADVRGVAVHPGRGTFYWADWNRQQPRIERASLDGSNRRVLIDTDLSLPNSLAIDFATDELCWTDAGTKTLECFSLRSRTRRVVAKNANYPFGIAITDDNIYWTDWNDKKIHVVSKATGERAPSLRSVLNTSGKLYGLVATQRTCPQVTNVCGNQNGGCSADQLCLPNDRGSRACICPDRVVSELQGPSICVAT